MNKAYFNYLKKECLPNIKWLPIILFAINLVNGISSGYNLHDGEQLVSLSQSSIIGIISLFVYGVLFSYSYFNAAMNIRSDRRSYIKASIQWIIISSIALGILGILVDVASKEILSLIFSIDVVMKTQIPWFFGGELNRMLVDLSILDIFYIIFTNISNMLVAGSLGLLCGSLAYRLKVKYSLLLFIGTPALIAMYCVNLSFNNPQLGEKILMKILELTQYIGANPHVAFLLNTFVTIISTLLFIKLLIKAPVKEYAFDLVSFKRK